MDTIGSNTHLQDSSAHLSNFRTATVVVHSLPCHSLVYLHPQTAQELRLENAPGLLVQVKGVQETFAILVLSENIPRDVLGLTDASKCNLLMESDKEIGLSFVQYPPMVSSIVVHPVYSSTSGLTENEIDAEISSFLRKMKPVHRCDIMTVNIEKNSQIRSFKIQIVDISPLHFGLINSNTKVTILKTIAPEKCVTFKDIGGYGRKIRELKDLCSKRFQTPAWLRRMNSFSRCGVLLHGPTGCGKTLIVQAIANELGVHLVKIDGHCIGSLSGAEVESSCRKSFTEAKNKSPSIILLEDLDIMAPKKLPADRDSRRIISILITLLREIYESAHIFAISTSMLPKRINPLLFAHKLFDQEIQLQLPNEQERKDILSVNMRKMNIANSICLTWLSQRMEGYTGADIVRVCNNTWERKLQSEIRLSVDSISDIDNIRQSLTLVKADFENVLKRTKPGPLHEMSHMPLEFNDAALVDTMTKAIIKGISNSQRNVKNKRSYDDCPVSDNSAGECYDFATLSEESVIEEKQNNTGSTKLSKKGNIKLVEYNIESENQVSESEERGKCEESDKNSNIQTSNYDEKHSKAKAVLNCSPDSTEEKYLNKDKLVTNIIKTVTRVERKSLSSNNSIHSKESSSSSPWIGSSSFLGNQVTNDNDSNSISTKSVNVKESEITPGKKRVLDAISKFEVGENTNVNRKCAYDRLSSDEGCNGRFLVSRTSTSTLAKESCSHMHRNGTYMSSGNVVPSDISNQSEMSEAEKDDSLSAILSVRDRVNAFEKANIAIPYPDIDDFSDSISRQRSPPLKITDLNLTSNNKGALSRLRRGEDDAVLQLSLETMSSGHTDSHVLPLNKRMDSKESSNTSLRSLNSTRTDDSVSLRISGHTSLDRVNHGHGQNCDCSDHENSFYTIRSLETSSGFDSSVMSDDLVSMDGFLNDQ